MKKLYPELVNKNGDGKLGVNYAGLLPVLLWAFKEQKQQIEQQ